MSETLYKFKAELLKVRATKAGTQWGVFEFFNLEKKIKVTVVGVLYPHNIGSIFHLEGTAKKNERFNEWQLIIKSYKLSEETSVRGIVNYLQREGPNIGEVRAEQLVKLFGPQTLNVLRDQPQRAVGKLSGFTLERVTAISEWLKKEQRLTKLKEHLYGIDLTPNQIGKIINQFGVEAPEKIKSDCFSLTKIDGIGFKTADKISEKIGIPRGDPERIKAGIIYAQKELMEEGHVCASHYQLLKAACVLLGIHKEKVIEQLKVMLSKNELLTERSDPKQHSHYPELFEELNDERRAVSESSVKN